MELELLEPPVELELLEPPVELELLLELELELELLLELPEEDSSPPELLEPIEVLPSSSEPPELDPPLVPAAVLPLSAPPVELLLVPDWLPPELVVSRSIGGPPVLLLDPSVPEPSVTGVNPPHAALIEITKPKASPLRILKAYRIVVARRAYPPKKKKVRSGVRHCGAAHPTERKNEIMSLTLYQLQFCPFCVDVRRAADQLGIELRIVDIAHEPEAAAMLQRRRGRRTVPVLGIPSDDGEELLGESRDIVDFLRGLTAA